MQTTDTICNTYDETRLWRLEDEDEPLEGRLLEAEVNGSVAKKVVALLSTDKC